MGSEAPSVVTVHITGFKKFHGVSENPTETIVNNLKGYMEKKGLPKGLVIGSYNILETAGEGAAASLYKILESALSGHDNSSSVDRVIWVGAKRYMISFLLLLLYKELCDIISS